LAEAAQGLVHEVVSSDQESLVLVDEHDREIGSLSKAACHDGEGVLHRAFSLFVFNSRGELLLQQRSSDKRLWPLYWSNSCCSHPRTGETMDRAIHRRLDQELGMTGDLHFVYKFQYQARYREIGAENELCRVYVGMSSDPVQANAHEVEAWRWISPERVDQELAEDPDAFTPWFKLEWPRVKAAYGELLGL